MFLLLQVVQGWFGLAGNTQQSGPVASLTQRPLAARRPSPNKALGAVKGPPLRQTASHAPITRWLAPRRSLGRRPSSAAPAAGAPFFWRTEAKRAARAAALWL